MKIRHLRLLRIFFALVFFLLTLFLFLDFRDSGFRAIAGEVLYLQFVPSLLQFLDTAAIGAAGFILVLILTLMFGRVYCSFVCPLGIFQDMVSRLARKRISRPGKKQKTPRFSYSRPHYFLWYAVLILTVLVFLAGSGLVLNLLDPFSSFGRMVSTLFRPLVLGANNLGALVLEQVGSHALYRVRWPVFVPAATGIALVTLLVVGWLSARHGRLYCNTLCPVGALLGLFSKISLFRIRISPDACDSCRRCQRVCKAGCIDLKEKTVDVHRCVACFNCLAACPGQGIAIQNHWRRPTRQNLAKPGRRGFLIGLAAAGMGLGSSRVDAGLVNPADSADPVDPVDSAVQARPTTIPETRTGPISPPGSVSVARFSSLCTACHLCVSVCPSRILVPALLDYGLSGMLQPKMDFRSGHCNYDCKDCLEVCPTGAILPLSRENKQQAQVGVARFIKENCVVYTDNTNCGACSEHCPTKAVDMVHYLTLPDRDLLIPKVNPDICVGCGGCEYACPTKPYKAIYVDGNPVHRKAKKPVEKAVEQRIDTSEEFPF
ncbi:4Fe-4S binding protein [Desulfotignum phosphitoxidans]|uniref:4Fe-4S ferredoxin iron-sulfur binding domain-containing protein n=1 Tax=Desulfotignum phosphitoxidans DSM 13687 TaxID=1286635 RepID=S0G384_9BACT|nr:4Fe-4S binding protein [Desulfotignum phosphitoxidans]EMS81355.1 4Fe-4S ferredoxin iron-sulfur binding domain-containing protein [Desulfotignum phosphitoxidans DSM 13687]